MINIDAQFPQIFNGKTSVTIPEGIITKEVIVPKTVKEVKFAGRNLFHDNASLNFHQVDGLIIDQPDFALVDTSVGTYAMLKINFSNRVLVKAPKVSGMRSGMNGVYINASKNITIDNATITSGDGHERDIIGIQVYGGRSQNSKQYWLANHQPVPVTTPSHSVEIRFSKFNGCYYGVYLSGADHCHVHNNWFDNNMRGVSIQDNANFNHIINNYVTNNVSTGIHIAYGSSNNRVMYNRIKTNAARGEGILQSYVGSKNNIFMNNHVIAQTPKYLIYCGAHSDGCIFENNWIEGRASKAVVAFEKTWVRTPSNPKARPAENDGFTLPGANMEGCLLVGNTFFMGEDKYIEAPITDSYNVWKS